MRIIFTEIVNPDYINTYVIMYHGLYSEAKMRHIKNRIKFIIFLLNTHFFVSV